MPSSMDKCRNRKESRGRRPHPRSEERKIETYPGVFMTLEEAEKEMERIAPFFEALHKSINKPKKKSWLEKVICGK